MKVVNNAEFPNTVVNLLHWLIPEVGELKKSHLASIRLRAAPSISGAEELGWRVAYGENILGAPSILIVGKIGANSIEVRQNLWLEEIQKAKKTAKIFLDYTDHHLGFNSPMTAFYQAVINQVDVCIVPSDSMSNLLASRWSGPIQVIEDPLEVSSSPPKQSSSKPITLLWFGHSSNIDFLIKFLSTQFYVGDHIRLIVLSNEMGLNHFAGSNPSSSAKIEFNLALWSVENMIEAAKISDVCIIPGDLNDARKIGVSSNRLITALTLGLPTAADNLPSYKEFSNYYCDLRGVEFREMLSDPLKFTPMVAGAQTALMHRFGIGKIKQDWKNLLLNSS